MIEFLFPNTDYDYIKYAAIITIELRQDNVCIQNLDTNPDNCFSIRIQYNGDYVDLIAGKVLLGTAKKDTNPDSFITPGNNSDPIRAQEEDKITQQFDISYNKFRQKIYSMLFEGDLD